MAFSSVNFSITPDPSLSGWTLIGTNPLYLKARVREKVEWQVAVTASGAPISTTGFLTLSPDKGEEGFEFELPAVAARTCDVYVRVPQQRGLMDPVQIGVVRDQ